MIKKSSNCIVKIPLMIPIWNKNYTLLSENQALEVNKISDNYLKILIYIVI